MLAGVVRLLGFFNEPWLSDREIHAIVGSPEPMDAAPVKVGAPHLDDATGTPLVIVTWNIERGMQDDAILQTLRRLDADILLLQEVDRFCKRTGYRDVARDLAAALDM
jgi:hypothetical protein